MTARAAAAAQPDVLHESSDRALKYLNEQLLKGFSGKFVIECNRGGIRRFHEERILHSVDLDVDMTKDKP